jgi:arylsulfatase A-like enzyme
MPTRPNILFLFTDDQRFDTICALGNREIHTPTLDRLVERGTAFTRAHIMGGSCPAVCMPSRAMLHTGRTLFRLDRQGQEVPAEHVLLGEHFRRAGYTTFGTGKWHNGPAGYTRSFADGGEIYFGGMNDHWNVPVCRYHAEGDYGEPRDVGVRMGEKRVRYKQRYDSIGGKHSSELFCDEAIDFLLRRRVEGRPFLAYVSFMAPHDPREMPAQFLTMYDPAKVELPGNFLPVHPFDNGELRVRDEMLAGSPRTEDEVRRHVADYYAMITHADAHMARVLDALEQTGQADRTIIVFSGDNGLAVGRHGLMGKQNLYDHSVRVPLVLAGPGIPAGRRSDAMCYLLDLMPTLCELSGLDVPGSCEGRSFAAAMSGGGGRDVLHLAYRNVQRGVTDGRHKLIEYVVNGRRTTQLFDLVSDPLELRNLSADAGNAPTLARLRSQLARWRTDYGDPSADFWGERGDSRPW